jgi:glycosidase/predicted alpha/beta superfamily hydrolase
MMLPAMDRFPPRASARLARVLSFLLAAAALLAAGQMRGAGSEVTPVSVPRFTHPGAGQVLYFVLTDRFANGSAVNDTGGIPGGPDRSGFDPTRISHYHGGDFIGLTAHLDYLKKLGVTAVWVTPPFKNKPMQSGTAGYHGYWILDFLHVDSHLGTDADFHEFVKQAHARGLKVILDIIVNHTADVIQYQGGKTTYISKAESPYRDAAGHPFDERAVAFNGLNSPDAFPPLSLEHSFPYVPFVPPAEANAKNPAWLNNPIYYHNRGNSTFKGENSLLGDFVGLDDVFTEQPAVVRGFIDIYRHWIEDFDVDGFRIDTAKHVNVEFWQAFAPAIREIARKAGHPGFFQFGEVMDESLNTPFLSEFSNTAGLDTTLDFGFMHAAINYVSKQGTAAALGDFLALDDYYTGPAGNVHTTVTFLGNHDLGRFAYFLKRDNPNASPEQLSALVKLGHGLLLLSRGQPVIYYGDEQGMIGRGGNDMQAREDMFASQSPDFKTAPLLGTTRTGADDKFDEQHPFYKFIHELAALRTAHPALSRGATIVRPTNVPGLLAFSRIDRDERVEYLAVFNNSRTETVTAVVPTSQPPGANFSRLHDSTKPQQFPVSVDFIAQADSAGRLSVTVAPLEFAVWRARTPMPISAIGPTISVAAPAGGSVLNFPMKETDGHTFPIRQEIRADVAGGDGVAEVTFTMTRASRPGQSELLGVDDAPPYRVFWRPPPDLAPGDELSFTATVDDLRGHRSAARVSGIKVADGTPVFGQKGANVPTLTKTPPPDITVDGGSPLTLSVKAVGTGPLSYKWLRDGLELPWATGADYSVAHASAATAGRYRVMVRGVAGTVIGPETVVNVSVKTAGRIGTMATIASKFVEARRVDVWLPPGYDADPAAHYPVIYMQDGQNSFDPITSFGGVSWEVDRAMLRLIQAGKTRGAIIVGIWNSGPGRLYDYMPQKAVTADTLRFFAGDPKTSAAPIRSDAYLKFIVEELKPLVDHRYRTQLDRAHTFVLGSSMGGLVSAYAMAEYPGVFGGAACVSTHWPAGDGAVVDYLAQHLPPPGTNRWYFDFGTTTLDAGYEPFQRRMDAAMRQAGYTEGRDWITRKFPGGEHSEKSWKARVEIPLLFLLGA